MPILGIISLALAVSSFYWMGYLPAAKLNAPRTPEQWEKEYDEWISTWRQSKIKNDYDMLVRRIKREVIAGVIIGIIGELILAPFFLGAAYLFYIAKAPVIGLIFTVMTFLALQIVLMIAYLGAKKRAAAFIKITEECEKAAKKAKEQENA